ncbi:MAG: mechanosensitive ion channel family protein [Candidatus Zixiibacteriota bacterium]
MDQLLGYIPGPEWLKTLSGVIVILVATSLASLVIRFILFRVIGGMTKRTSTTLDDLLLRATRRYISFLVYIFGLSFVFDFLEKRLTEYVGGEFFKVVDGIIYGLGVVAVAIIIIKIITTILSWYGETIAQKTDTHLDDELIPLLDRTVKIILYTLAVLVVLDHFNVDVKGMLTVLGVGSLAVALAAQDTLANMIAGFTIMIDRPFRIGDMLSLPDGHRAKVYEIGIRSTKFLTYNNTMIIVPNAELVKSTIQNMSYPDPMIRCDIDVGVGYDSDISLVNRVMIDEALKHPDIRKEPEPRFLFLDFGDSSLNVSLRCYVEQAEDYRRVSSELREQIINRFRIEGIEIPFPQRVVTMVPGKMQKD